jgi:uncharacterized protein (TIGR02271 family)
MQTVTALFDDREHALQAAERLRAHGIADDRIHVISAEPEGPEAASEVGRRGNIYPMGFASAFKSFFMSDEDRSAYSEGVHRGGTTISVDADEAEVAKAVDILEECGAVDLDEREQSWRGEGWAGAVPEGTTSQSRGRTVPGATEAIPVAQEELRIGKREVNTGRVRVYSRVVEIPVEESVNLREEHLDVERRPVDRRVEAGDQVFQERSIDVEAHSEEPVVDKQARVVEEVVIKKNADERTETVRDKVRRTEVEVDDDSTSVPTTKRRT